MTLVCTGLQLDRYARPVAGPCGTTWTGETLDHATVAGWRAGPPVESSPRPALCPSCVHSTRHDDQDDDPSPIADLVEQLSLFPTTERADT